MFQSMQDLKCRVSEIIAEFGRGERGGQRRLDKMMPTGEEKPTGGTPVAQIRPQAGRAGTHLSPFLPPRAGDTLAPGARIALPGIQDRI